MTPDQIRGIADPAQRAKEAEGFIRRGQTAITEVRAIRDAAVAELRVMGWTQRRAAEYLGITPAAVNKIDRAQGVTSAPQATQIPEQWRRQ